MWPFKRKASVPLDDAQAILIKAIVDEGIARRQVDAEIAAARGEVEKLRLQFDKETLVERREEDRKDRAHRQALREQRAAHADKMREHQRTKRAGQRAAVADGGCKVCIDPGDVHLTANEILWHNMGHGGATAPVDMHNIQ